MMNPGTRPRSRTYLTRLRSLLLGVSVCATLAPPVLAGIQASASAPIPYLTIQKGQRSGIRERKFVVIRTTQEWDVIWQAHRAGVSPSPPAPAFDPQQEMVVAVFAGEKSTGGHQIEIARIEEDRAAGSLNVSISETSPAPNTMVTQALTQPHHIVRLKRVDMPATFKFEGS